MQVRADAVGGVPGSQRYAHGTRNFDRLTTHFGREWLQDMSGLASIAESPMWGMIAFPGFGMRSSNLKGVPEGSAADGRDKAKQQGMSPDLAYSAARTATKAAHALATEWSDTHSRTTFAILLPVVVLRGSLFEVWLDGGGGVRLERTDRSRVFWRDPSLGVSPLVIDVVTEAGLDGFLDDLALTVDAALSEVGQRAAQP
jgi:hypothetical protein